MLRASLKSLFSRKLRLTLAIVAIVLGVSFLSGAFVLTDSLGARFERLFTSINQDVDVQVALSEDGQDEDPQPKLTQAQIDAMAALPGARAVSGDVSAIGVIPFDREDGKPATTSGAPQIGGGVKGDDPFALVQLADGRWPSTDDEVVITRYTADQTHSATGDRLKIFLPEVNEAREFTITGTAVYDGDRESLAGETLILFEEGFAQRTFYGQEGLFSGASLAARDGVTQEQLREQVAPIVPNGFEAKTGEQANEDAANDVQEGLSALTTYFFGPFAIVALLVGIFLIFNTFNILVAQRASELALFRAMGASWGQVTGSVLIEAVLVGVVGSTLGLLAGIGLGLAGSAALTSLIGAQLPGAGITVGATPVILAYVVGILVTVVSAFVPAIRASAVPPLAAMREVNRPDKPLRVLTIVGLVFAVPGIALLILGLVGSTLAPLLFGSLLAFLGVMILSPLLTRPLAGLIGRVVGWGMSGRLGVRNALRNPRRTAVTAAALMIGVTLVSAASVLGESFTRTIDQTINATVGAEVIVQTNTTGGPPGEVGFPDRATDQVRQLPGVEEIVPLYISIGARVDDAAPPFGGTFATDDLAVARDMFAMKAVEGDLRTLRPGEFVTDQNTFESRGWAVGQSVPIELDQGGEQQYRLVGVYESTPIWTDTLILPKQAVADFAGPLALQGYVSLDDGADTDAVVADIERVMADYPLVTVGDRSALLDQFDSFIDIALGIIYVLLGVAILIALLGILNTLLLSIFERTRELGLLRAVGLNRRGVMRMVGTESVVMAVFGCLLGIIVGVGLGAALAAALIDRDFLTVVAIPWVSLIVFVVITVIAGVLAALWPAWRAARLNVLEAIAYE
ncbi:ABC transporter permease [Phytohabitans sp. ZYX-F-186]|uniref:ABC transporter permease n=1 Tax=Phytohabitans maris TaxID=3071409 RepID=A0ABU0ZHH6_9ACTN|nr:ABC transporter permease [Phytohabitans sp. ZYX-F-186]MDQ7906428.1 ABC transporter permease [Phytohabitans sp. ZYX-F-186]